MSKAQSTKKYDLEERTAKFGESVIDLVKKVRRNEITRPLITQLVKAATSVGANYSEADDAVSKRDFKNKIGICKKESREAKHFLRMLSKAVPDLKEEIQKNWQEAKELNLIFNAIFIAVSRKPRPSGRGGIEPDMSSSFRGNSARKSGEDVIKIK